MWDDNVMLTDNPFIKSGGGLAEIWFGHRNPDYFPLASTSLWLEWRIWGTHAWGYHVTNILLHALSVVLLWEVLKQLRIPGAWFGALIFAVHPVNVESVAWIAERKNTLAMPFYLLAALAWLRWDDDKRPRQYWMSLGMFALALLSKTSVVMLPPVLLLATWWRHGRVTARDLLALAPFFALSLGAGLLTIWFQTQNAIHGVAIPMGGWPARIATLGRALWFYLWKDIAPVNLSLLYPHWPITGVSWTPLMLFIAMFLVFAMLAFGVIPSEARADKREYARGALFALGYFVLSLFPVLGFFRMYYFRFSQVADQWQYVAIIGAASAGGSALGLFAERNRLGGRCLGAAVALVLAALTWNRCFVVHSDDTAWADVLRRDPMSWLGNANFAVSQMHQKNTDAALKYALRSAELNPDFGDVHTLAGTALQEKGRLDEAIAQFREAIQITPDAPDAHDNLGVALMKQGKLDEAISEYQTALNLRPEFTAAQVNLGIALSKQGKAEQAMMLYRAALTTAPEYPEGHYHLGVALVGQKRFDDARAEFEEAVRLKADYAEALNDLGAGFAREKRFDEAIANYRKALAAKPDLAEAHNNMGAALYGLQHVDEAIAEFEAAVRLKPDYATAQRNLTALRKLRGKQ